MFSQFKMWVTSLTALVIVVIPASRAASATHPRLEFAELAHTADVIFIGTVLDKSVRTMAAGEPSVTDVTFEDLQIIAMKGDAAAILEALTLAFVGSSTQDLEGMMTGTPAFMLGSKYLVFTLLDGRMYVNPLVGGDQGLFRIIVDTETGEEYPLAAGDAGIGLTSSGRLRSIGWVKGIANGRAVRVTRQTLMMSAPVSASHEPAPARSRQAEQPEPVLTLNEFVTEIYALLDAPPPAKPVLRGLRTSLSPPASLEGTSTVAAASGPDGAIPEGRGPGQPDDLSRMGRTSPILSGGPLDPQAGEDPKRTSSGYRGTLPCQCGHRTLPAVMEQLPAGSWGYQRNADAMWQFNQFIDLYRTVESNGSVGRNGQSEFAGWPDDATLSRIYSVSGNQIHWGGALAMCLMPRLQGCGEIQETDIVFNPAYDWAEDLDDSYGRRDRFLYLPILMHELGHSWGMQLNLCGEESYRYDVPSIMHAAPAQIIEDG